MAGHCRYDNHLKGYWSNSKFLNLLKMNLSCGMQFTNSSAFEPQIVSMGRKKFSADFQLMFRLLKLFLFIGSVITLVILFTTLHLTVGDIFQSLLAFLPTGLAILQVCT